MENKTIILTTDRLILREFTHDDTDNLWKITSDAYVMRFFPATMNRTETEKFLQEIIGEYTKHGHCFWAAERKTDHEFVGMVGLLAQTVDGKLEIEIAYRLVKKYWRQGYASEAAIACRDYAFQQLKCERVISLIDKENIASVAVALKMGMAFEKTTFIFEQYLDVYSIRL
jgi:[ribosomal protein S5]-alanine N-acetyltransferase